MKILLFGVLADTIGRSSVEMEESKDLNALKSELLLRYPLLQNHQFRIAVNKEVSEDNRALNQSDEIALLPPFSGG